MAEERAGFHNNEHTWQSGSNGGKLEPETPAVQPPKCPQCGSKKLYKDGFRYLDDRISVQRWLCRECQYRFSNAKLLQKKPNWHINSGSALLSKRQVCELLTEESKNLTEVARQEVAQREGTKQTNDMKAKIIDHAFWMRKEGYAEATITRRIRLLTTLTKRGANLFDPESIKETIAKQQGWNLKTKAIAVDTYACFLKMLGGKWEPPEYKPIRKLPFIPTEQELSELIAGCNRKTAAFLQLLKEAGMRSGEAWMLKWVDFNFENNTVSITPEKGSEPRLLKISNNLAAMLNCLPKDQPETFKGSLRHFARSFRRQRTRIAHKLRNDRIAKITFHTFRHWKATMEYAKTKDILHVMKMLGHKNIQNTLLYTQLVNFETDEFHSATATTVQEAQKLVETGFEYVCSFDQVKLFRKRK